MLIKSSLRRKGVVECYMKVVMKMYKEFLTHVKGKVKTQRSLQ